MSPSTGKQELIGVAGGLIATAMLLLERFYPSLRLYFLAYCAVILCSFFGLLEWSNRRRVAAAIAAARERPLDIDD